MTSSMYPKSKKQWNVCVGCEFDCTYCTRSFKAQAKRQKQNCQLCYEYEPHTHPERLTRPLPKTGDDEFIFVGASGDIAFCPTDFLKKIVQRIETEKEKTFLIQSKNPRTFDRVALPSNVLLGITLETNRDAGYREVSKAPLPSKRYRDLLGIDHPRKMVTVEPVMKFDHDIMIEWITAIGPELVWLGFDSKPGTLPEPSRDEVMALHDDLVARGVSVLLKTIREGRTVTA